MIRVLSWNANRINPARIEEVEEFIVGTGVIGLLQEVSSWGDQIAAVGHTVLSRENCYCAIMLPLALEPSISDVRHTRYTTSVFLAGWLCVTLVYLVNSWGAISEYEYSIDDLSSTLQHFKNIGAKDFIIGGDVQVEPDRDWGEHFVGPNCKRGQAAAQDMLDRRAFFLGILQEFRIFLASTAVAQTDASTIQRFADGSRSQIDVLGCTAGLAGDCCVLNSHRALDSDHFPLRAEITLLERQVAQYSQRRSSKGWQPTSDREGEKFQALCMEGLSLAGAPEDLGKHTIPAMVECVESQANTVSFSTSASRRGQLWRRPPALRDADRLCRSLPAGPERTVARRRARALRRRWVALRGPRGREQHLRRGLRVRGELTHDRVAWGHELQRHCEQKYQYPPDACPVPQHHLLEHLRNLTAWHRLDGRPPLG